MLSSYKLRFLIVYITSLLLLCIPIFYLYAPLLANNPVLVIPNFSSIVSNLFGIIIIASYFFYFWSCYILVKGKGYNRLYTLVGLFPVNGLILLIFLPSKFQSTTTVSKSRAFVSRVPFTIAIILNCIIVVIACVLVGIGFNNSSTNIGQVFGTLVIIWFLGSIIIGALYIVIGIGRLIYEKAKKITNSQKWHISSFIFSGITIMVITVIIFFVISFALSFFATGPDNIQLPNLPTVSPAPNASPEPTTYSPGQGMPQ